jgi:cell shape-determining protein MreC
MSTSELVERLRHLEADAKDLRTAADRLLEADQIAARLDELERENARMRDVLERISQWKQKSAILESECELMQSIARAALAGSGEK